MHHKILIGFFLFVLGNEAMADTYMCTAKYAAGITEKDDDVTQAQSGEYDKQYIADELGFRAVGQDKVKLSKCRFIDGRPTFCEDPGDSWSGFFMLSSNRVFTYFVVIGGNNGVLEAMVVKGKCSKT